MNDIERIFSYLKFFSYSAISFIKTKNNDPADIQEKDKQNGFTYSVYHSFSNKRK